MHQVLTYVHVLDVARALVKAIDATLPLPFTCHVEDGHTYTMKQTARIFTNVLSVRVRAVPIPRLVFRAYCAGANLWTAITGKPSIMGLDKGNEALAKYWIGGTQKLTRILRYQPEILLEEGLKRQVEWARQEGLL